MVILKSDSRSGKRKRTDVYVADESRAIAHDDGDIVEQYCAQCRQLVAKYCANKIQTPQLLAEHRRVLAVAEPNDLRVPAVALCDAVASAIVDHLTVGPCGKHVNSLEESPNEEEEVIDPFISLYRCKDLAATVYARISEELSSSSPVEEDGLDRWLNVACLFAPVVSAKTPSQILASDSKAYPQLWRKKWLDKKRLRALFTSVWMALTKQQLSDAQLQRVLRLLPDHVLPAVNNAEFLADFIMTAYSRGSPYNVLALDSLVNLVQNHNIDVPNFYADVYNMIRPAVCYSPQRERFFRTLNLFMSSSHVPTAVCASFVKRICRAQLLAPVDCVMPMQKLVRNILIRYPPLQPMANRDIQDVISDPFNDEEPDPALTNALQSSLWEIKSLQSHWHPDVAAHSGWVHKQLPQMECAVRWRRLDELWKLEMDKPLIAAQESANSHNETSGPPSKKRKPQHNRRRQAPSKVAVNHVPPTQLFAIPTALV